MLVLLWGFISSHWAEGGRDWVTLALMLHLSSVYLPLTLTRWFSPGRRKVRMTSHEPGGGDVSSVEPRHLAAGGHVIIQCCVTRVTPCHVTWCVTQSRDQRQCDVWWQHGSFLLTSSRHLEMSGSCLWIECVWCWCQWSWFWYREHEETQACMNLIVKLWALKLGWK